MPVKLKFGKYLNLSSEQTVLNRSLSYLPRRRNRNESMVYRRSKTNIRKPPRRRRAYRSKSTTSRRPRSRVARAKKSPCKCTSELTPAAKFALAQLDPFHPLCLGGKIPDTNTMPSIANCSTDQVNSGVATTGFMTGFAFRPFYNQAVITPTSVSGTAVSWGASITANATDRRDYTAFKAQFEATRPVAHAVRISSPLAPTTATGFVHIGLSVESTYGNPASTWQFPTSVNEMTGLAHYKRFTLAALTQSPLTIVNKWIDERAFQYADTNQSAASTTAVASENQNPFGWCWATIVVLVEGAPSGSTPLSAEHVLHTESLPRKDSILLGTQAAPNSPGVMSSVSTMSGDQDFTHTEAGQETYVQQGLEAFGRGAAQAGEQAWNGVALPLFQRIGYAATSYAVSYALASASGRGGLPGVNSNPARLALT